MPAGSGTLTCTSSMDCVHVKPLPCATTALLFSAKDIGIARQCSEISELDANEKKNKMSSIPRLAASLLRRSAGVAPARAALARRSLRTAAATRSAVSDSKNETEK